MRVLQLLTGIVGLFAAAWFGIPALVQAWKLLSLPRTSPGQVHFEFCIGNLTLSGWTLVVIGGGMGILLAAFSYYVLFPPSAQSRGFDGRN